MLDAYSKCSGWDEILNAVKERLSHHMPGNVLRNNDIREYYENTERKAVIKRIRRIVKQNVQKDGDPQTTPGTKKYERMSQIIKKNQTRYATKKLLEERKSFMISHFVNDESSYSSDENVSLAEHLAGVAGSRSQENETPATQPGTSGEGLRKTKKKSKKTSQKELVREANKAHIEMCTKTMSMMDKIEKFIDKHESDDESD